MSQQVKPTESELEILRIIWARGPSTVRQIHDELSTEKDIFYTTTLKTMQVMHDKELLSRDTSSRSHIYAALISAESLQKSMLDKLKKTVFGGSTEQLILSAIGSDQLRPSDLETLKSIIDKLDEDA